MCIVQLIVMDVSREGDQPQVYINPQILAKDGVEVSKRAACRCPTCTRTVERAANVRVRAWDVEGQEFERDLDGLTAVCLQHEMDHLAGKLFVDYLSGLETRADSSKARERAPRARQRGTETCRPRAAARVI
jgi:peptide deformylase